MTERELKSLNGIRAMIEWYEEKLEELEQYDGVGSMNMDGMPHGTTPGDPVAKIATDRVELRNKIAHYKAELAKKEAEIIEYIERVPCEEIKLIMALRYIDQMEWTDIAEVWGERIGRCVDRTTLSKRVRKFLENNEKQC